MKGLLNKNINKMKLTLTTECNLACPYCFVKKTDQRMDWQTAKKSIDILIHSKGNDKLLSLYGGEPLLNFNILKKICPYTIEQASKAGKKITISICTNLIALNSMHLHFFRKYKIKVIFSHVGDRTTHNKMRPFPNGKGSDDIIIHNLLDLKKMVDIKNIGVSLCLFPDTASRIHTNISRLRDFGMRYFNIEIIRNFRSWDSRHIESFIGSFEKVLKQIDFGISKGDYLFINPVNWEISRKLLTKRMGLNCPFEYRIEVYPNGLMALSPFLLNLDDSYKYIVADIKSGVQKILYSCTFSSDSLQCHECQIKYFSGYTSDLGADKCHHEYTAMSMRKAQEIIAKSRYDKRYSDYINFINKELCF